eukprot:1187717-Prorocentrum_minimum.AAC.3
MAVRLQFENSNDIGVFCNVTNKYIITAFGGSENFYRVWFGYKLLTKAPPLVWNSVFEAECADHIPIVKTSVAGTTLVGRMTVGT